MDKKKQINLPPNQPTHFPEGKVQICLYSWFIYQDQGLLTTYALLIGLGRKNPTLHLSQISWCLPNH
jgi:hypothetical protein